MIRIPARKQAGVSKVLDQPLCASLQEDISGRAAKTVIDISESFQIDQRYGQLSAGCGGAAYVQRDPFEEQTSVGKSRKLVVVGQVIEPFLFLNVINGE